MLARAPLGQHVARRKSVFPRTHFLTHKHSSGSRECCVLERCADYGALTTSRHQHHGKLGSGHSPSPGVFLLHFLPIGCRTFVLLAVPSFARPHHLARGFPPIELRRAHQQQAILTHLPPRSLPPSPSLASCMQFSARYITANYFIEESPQLNIQATHTQTTHTDSHAYTWNCTGPWSYA